MIPNLSTFYTFFHILSFYTNAIDLSPQKNPILIIVLQKRCNPLSAEYLLELSTNFEYHHAWFYCLRCFVNFMYLEYFVHHDMHDRLPRLHPFSTRTATDRRIHIMIRNELPSSHGPTGCGGSDKCCSIVARPLKPRNALEKEELRLLRHKWKPESDSHVQVLSQLRLLPNHQSGLRMG